MIFDHVHELAERIETLSGRRVYTRPRIVEDTTSFFNICSGYVLRLGGSDYFVQGDTYEGRFGVDDQPKFWVKYATCLTTGEPKIIKLVFHEQLRITIGHIANACFTRSVEKESRILDLVKGHPRFMQGVSVADSQGNTVRIIDRIQGKPLFKRVCPGPENHEAYFCEQMPIVMQEVIACIEAIVFLHANGEHHGDIRNDHILLDSRDGRYKWIDFDSEVNFSDYDAWGVGNVINFVVGGGLHTFHNVRQTPQSYPHLRGELCGDDAQMLFRHRVANLRKLFPYIPADVNRILMRFSAGANNFYEDIESQLIDLRAVFPPPST